MEMTSIFPMILRIFCALSLAFAVVSSTGRVHAEAKDDIGDARAHYKKGLELYEDHAFDAALIEFQRAYDMAPTYKILYNLALVHLQLNDWAGAARSFKGYLEEGGKKIDQKRRTEVERELKKLEGRVGNVEVVSNVEAAEVLVDDQEVAETPLDGPLSVNSGKRRITLSKTGYIPVTRVITIAGGETKKVEFELRTGTAPPSTATPSTKPTEAPTVTSPAPTEPEKPGRKVPWVWWGVAGGLAVGTGVMGVLTLTSQNDLDDKKNKPSQKDDLDSAATKTRTFAIVTDVLLVGTVATAGIAAYLTFGPQKDARRETRRREKRPSEVSVGIGPGSVQLSGSF
jgi:hypothetical protein